MTGLRDFVPPIVWRVRERLRSRPARALREIFPDYENAAEHCRSGWNDAELARRVVEDAIVIRERVRNGDVPILELRAIAAVGWAFAQLTNMDALSVLDFGGSAGMNYFAVKACFPEERFRWHVVETPATVAAARVLEEDELTFVDDVGRVLQCDLVFSAGALQYHPRPLELLERLTGIGAPCLALFRTAMTDGEPFFAVQKASVGQHLRATRVAQSDDSEVCYPVTFLPRRAYRDLLSREYEIVAELDEGILNRGGSYNVNGYGMFCRRRRP